MNFKEKVKRLLEAKENNSVSKSQPSKKEKVCEHCHKKSTKSNPVGWDVNPYDQELGNDNTKHWICGNCSGEFAADV
jgi:hypothetical protein